MAKRKFNTEFKQAAVRLVQEQGYSVVEAAKSLTVDPATIRSWIKKFSAVSGGGAAAGDRGMRAELQRLRAENKRLLLEREILKKATVFFAKYES